MCHIVQNKHPKCFIIQNKNTQGIRTSLTLKYMNKSVNKAVSFLLLLVYLKFPYIVTTYRVDEPLHLYGASHSEEDMSYYIKPGQEIFKQVRSNSTICTNSRYKARLGHKNTAAVGLCA